MTKLRELSTTETWICEDWPGIARLLGRSPFKPFSGWGKWAAEQLSELANERAQLAFRNPLTTTWMVGDRQHPLGFGSISELPWDTEQLKQSAGRIDYLVADGTYNAQLSAKNSLLRAIKQNAEERAIRHLSARVDASDLTGLHTLESNGFQTVDGILTFAADLTVLPNLECSPDFNIRIADSDDAEVVGELARTAYVFDRFHADPEIADKDADDLHAAWVRNSCQGLAADAVVLAEDDHGVLGFVTTKLQKDTSRTLGATAGTIVLVAVAKRARGRGVGKAITLAALEWFRDRQALFVEVGTQLRNLPATRLYQNCGFRLVASSISLRTII